MSKGLFSATLFFLSFLVKEVWLLLVLQNIIMMLGKKIFSIVFHMVYGTGRMCVWVLGGQVVKRICEIFVTCVRLKKQEKEKAKYEIMYVHWLGEYLVV